MYQIEEFLIEAMRMWVPFRYRNTSSSVCTDKTTGQKYCLVKVYNEPVATWDSDSFTFCITDENNTVALSRINALLQEFDEILGYSLYLVIEDGHLKIADPEKNEKHLLELNRVYSLNYERGFEILGKTVTLK